MIGRKVLILTLLLIMLIVSTTIYSAPAFAQKKEKVVLVLGRGNDVDTMNSLMSTTGTAFFLNNLIYSSMLGYDV